MGKNVAVFVDVANIFYAAKAAGVDIDYVTLLKSATAGRDFVRAYAYTGLDPDNENQKNFHAFLARHGFKVVSKDIRKYGDGKVKANLDIELVVDLMKTARNLDVAVVVSGDGDFAPAIRAVQEMGVRVEVISFRGNTSSDLIEVADLFTDIGQIARVDKSSTRSGRRVADDDEDLSMTEVPEKQSEGRGDGRRRGERDRGRGRGRDRDRDREELPVAAAASGRAALVALPGERLSKAGDEDVDDELVEAPIDAVAGDLDGGAGADDLDAAGEEGRRRRRRRGGRGRGRGRGREEGGELVEGADAPVPEMDAREPREPREAREPREPRDARPPRPVRDDFERTPFDEPELPVTRGPRTNPFGSVWDTQIGTPAARAGADLEPLDDEDLEEPAIPEYLLAERRGGRGRQGPGQGPGGRGGRGGRGGSYAAAIDRERYGGRGTVSRYGEPRGGAPGLPRPGQDRGRPPRGDRPERGERPDRDRDRPRSSEPWQEVPPELEELIRAQVARVEPRREMAPSGPARRAPAENRSAEPGGATAAAEEPAAATDAAATDAPATRRRRRTTASEASEGAAATAGPGDETAAGPDATATTSRRRTTRRATAAPEGDASAGVAVPAEDAAPAVRRRTTRRAASASAEAAEPAAAPAATPDAGASTGEVPARRRTTRRSSATAEPAEPATVSADASGSGEGAAATPRRRTRRTAGSDEAAGG